MAYTSPLITCHLNSIGNTLFKTNRGKKIHSKAKAWAKSTISAL